MLAPVVLFVYNRPGHTRQTVEALADNALAGESELFVFSDAAKNEGAVDAVNAVRAYIKTITGFRKVTVTEQSANKGLAASIIDGVTEIVNRYGKIIVLEDDIVTSPCFLRYMNDALEFYEHEKKVWHIAGYCYPINKEGIPDTYFSRVMSCWGWATWQDRWKFFEKDTDKLLRFFNAQMLKDFNVGRGKYFSSQIVGNKRGTLNTWAVYWYAAIFLRGGLCLNPRESLVRNIGMDGSGVNCGETNEYNVEVSIGGEWRGPASFETDITENMLVRKRLQSVFHTPPFVVAALGGALKRIRKGGLLNAARYYREKYLK